MIIETFLQNCTNVAHSFLSVFVEQQFNPGNGNSVDWRFILAIVFGVIVIVLTAVMAVFIIREKRADKHAERTVIDNELDAKERAAMLHDKSDSTTEKTQETSEL